MKRVIRRTVVAAGLIATLAGGAWTVQAQGGARGQGQTEAHPLLRNSIHQLEGVRDRLQKAPTDFGGHREKAVDAISHAIAELEQAIAYDKK